VKFRLIHQGNDLRLTSGEYLIGRSSECQIVLEDPLVSRLHALLRVGDDEVRVEDLRSRNGVRLNGRQVEGSTVVSPGDGLEIGGQELVLVTGTSPRSEATTARQGGAGAQETLATLGALANKALALGNATEAERILSHYLDELLRRMEEGERPDGQVVTQAVAYAVSLACETRRGRWLGYVFRVFNALGTQAPAEVIDKLYGTATRLDRPESGALADYIASCQGRRDSMTPGQRFQLSRAEGLLRLLQV
jgi:pSer/pThr/pTyr-binding forkhead associated (FHA) protein